MRACVCSLVKGRGGRREEEEEGRGEGGRRKGWRRERGRDGRVNGMNVFIRMQPFLRENVCYIVLV